MVASADRTLAIIKPGAVSLGYAPGIEALIEKNSFAVLARMEVRPILSHHCYAPNHKARGVAGITRGRPEERRGRRGARWGQRQLCDSQRALCRRPSGGG